MTDASPHPRLVGVASCPMPHRVAQEEIETWVLRHFAGHLAEAERLQPLFRHTGIQTRSLCRPLEWFAEEKGFAAKNQAFLDFALEACETAIRRLLVENPLPLERVRHLIAVTTTGLATPTLEARLMNRLPFSPTAQRHPLWGFGCAGGAFGLIEAAELLRGDPDGLALLLNVELCSLTFHFRDYSRSNFVATALFSDGVTACLVAGARTGFPGLEVLATDSYLWSDTEDVMGWNFQDHGMQVVFSERIPDVVRSKARPSLERFLRSQGLTLEDVEHWLVHPGGPKVLSAYARSLPVPRQRWDLARDVFQEHGNCSSASVMLVLERFLRQVRPEPGSLAVVTALGPGFSSGSLILRC